MSEYFKTLIDNVRKDERDKIFSAMDAPMMDRKTWNSIDVFNINDFKQSIIIEMNNNKKDADV